MCIRFQLARQAPISMCFLENILYLISFCLLRRNPHAVSTDGNSHREARVSIFLECWEVPGKDVKDLYEANEKMKVAHLRSCIEPSFLGKLDLIPELISVQKMMKAITDQVDKIHPLNDHEY